MLDLLRGFSKGWTAKILIGLLVASFAIWGISGSILYGGSNTAVQVGNTTITAQQFRNVYENQLNLLSQQAGRRLTRQEADLFGLQNNVVALVTTGAVLDENAQIMGLGVSTEQLAKSIANDPSLRDFSGKVDPEAIKRTLRNRGITQEEFEEQRRRQAIRNQLQAGISDSIDMPEVMKEAISTFRNEKRVFDYVSIGAEVLEKAPEPTDEDIGAYYEENKSQYMAPEYRKLTLLTLQASDLAKPQEVTDEELRAAYDARANGLSSPETRRVQQLVLKDKAEADDVAQKIKNGTDFDDILKELGKSVADIDLGVVTKSELPDSKVGEAAFNAELNKPTDVVEGLFGPVIIRVSEINESKTTAFDDIKEELRSEIALQKAGDEVFNTFDAVEDERAAGSNLVDAAKVTGLKTRVVTKIDAQGRDENGNAISNIPVLQQLLRAAFDSEPGDDTRELAVGSDGFLWYEVEEIIPTRQKELEEVKSDVRDAWVAEETNKLVTEKADKIAERIRAGDEMNAVLAEMLPADSIGSAVKYETTDALARNGNAPKIGNAAVQEGFSGVKGDIKTAQAPEGNVIVLRIADVQAPEDKQLTQEDTQQLNLTAADDILNQIVQDLQTQVDVSINPAGIEAAFNPYGGGGHGGM
jgi:peptidyl-prolyl cis-trans isomerase D